MESRRGCWTEIFFSHVYMIDGFFFFPQVSLSSLPSTSPASPPLHSPTDTRGAFPVPWGSAGILAGLRAHCCDNLHVVPADPMSTHSPHSFTLSKGGRRRGDSACCLSAGTSYMLPALTCSFRNLLLWSSGTVQKRGFKRKKRWNVPFPLHGGGRWAGRRQDVRKARGGREGGLSRQVWPLLLFCGVVPFSDGPCHSAEACPRMADGFQCLVWGGFCAPGPGPQEVDRQVLGAPGVLGTRSDELGAGFS